ncbi:autotransporter assembly complex family protein [Ahrensia sp. R2A130]|uniref:autotransporter assembly complex protein TamA n=1 Tax=Ahrensia sp. R2A130 TaxID=744979 RepID=UPI0001E09446|nr:autotransporter assembly complex family protein [Ahrensia sp. R2A130]EFL89577.1 surface antigen [Ahrensia sp. R2A130]
MRRTITSYPTSWLTTGSLALALSAGAVAQAQAASVFGICIPGTTCESVEDDQASGFIDPKRYDVEFIFEPLDGREVDSDVKAALKSASGLYSGREQPVAGSAGLISRAKGDYRSILAGMYNNALYGGEISILVNGISAAEIEAGRSLPERSQVTIRVTPGPTYRFGKADVQNAAPPTNDESDVTKSFADINFTAGARAKAGTVRNAGRLAVEQWKQQGHALARVEGQEAVAVHPDQQLNVTLRMDPGPVAYYDAVDVSGTKDMDPEFVAYMTGLKPGEEYDPDDLERARKRLDRLGVFSTRKFELGKSLGSNGLLPVSLTVAERKKRRIGVGATLSSIDGIGVETYWLHRNLFGKAERLRLDASIGGVGGGIGETATVDPEEFDYNLAATFTKPGVFTPDTDLVTNVFAKRDFNETFTETSTGGSVKLTNYVTDSLTVGVGMFGEYGKFEDAFGTRNFATTGLLGELLFDNRRDKLDPKQGFYVELDAKPFYEAEFGNAGGRFTAEGRTYFGFGEEKKTVLAVRGKVGTLLGPPISETPPDLLFLAGGGASVRGYGFKTIGITAANGQTAGGRSLLEGSVELRQRFGGNFGAVAFVDVGTVGSDSFSGFDEDLQVGVGLGVRYYTGLGPIRLDVAIPLDPGSDDAGFAIYAGIGQAF